MNHSEIHIEYIANPSDELVNRHTEYLRKQVIPKSKSHSIISPLDKRSFEQLSLAEQIRCDVSNVTKTRESLFSLIDQFIVLVVQRKPFNRLSKFDESIKQIIPSGQRVILGCINGNVFAVNTDTGADITKNMYQELRKYAAEDVVLEGFLGDKFAFYPTRILLSKKSDFQLPNKPKLGKKTAVLVQDTDLVSDYIFCDDILPIEKKFTLELENLHVYKRADSENLVIAGYASVDIPDSEKPLPHIVTLDAMRKALTRFMANENYRNVMLNHSNLQVGRVIESFEYSGKTIKTEVDKTGLFVVVEMRPESDLAAMRRVYQDISSGELRSFSIGGEALEYTLSDDGNYLMLTDINLFEITVCDRGKNPGAKFVPLNKQASHSRLSLIHALEEQLQTYFQLLTKEKRYIEPVFFGEFFNYGVEIGKQHLQCEEFCKNQYTDEYIGRVYNYTLSVLNTYAVMFVADVNLNLDTTIWFDNLIELSNKILHKAINFGKIQTVNNINIVRFDKDNESIGYKEAVNLLCSLDYMYEFA